MFNVVTGDNFVKSLNKKLLSTISEEDLNSIKSMTKVNSVLCGIGSFNVLQRALLSAANHLLLKNEKVVVNASSVVSNNKSILIFDDMLNCNYNDLISSGYTIISKTGIERAFNGITHSNESLKRNRGDIVEKRGEGHLITQTLPPRVLIGPKPSSILFVQRDGKAPGDVKKLKSEEALDLLSKSTKNYLFRGAPLIIHKTYTDLFNEILKDIPAFIVKTNKEDDLQNEIHKINEI